MRPEAPFNARPVAPEPGQTVQIYLYSVECRRLATNAKHPIWYYVRNVEGTALAFDHDWDRLCHVQGWYPMAGLDPDQALPRKEAPREQRKPRMIVHDEDPREALPLFPEE